MKKNSLTFVDLFSGAGGLLQGFLDQGFKPIFALENWKPAIVTHGVNFPNVPVIDKDIREVSKREVSRILNGRKVDVVIGGPPCQGFSTIGNRDPEDRRNNLVLEFVRFVEILKPRFFLMENVRGLVSAANGRYAEVLLEKFRALGYKNVTYKILNAAEYGVPQLRKRVIFLGSLDAGDIFFPKPTHSDDNFSTVGEVISDLIGQENKIENHSPMNHNPIVRERIGLIPEGSGLPKNVLPRRLLRGTRSDFRNNKIKNFSHVYKRLHRGRPATTMVPGHNAFPLHPTENRSLTVREAARIQTFPDDLVFKGTRQEQCILVGNAVPVRLARVLAGHIKALASKTNE